MRGIYFDGKLGLLVAQVLSFLKGEVTVCGKHPKKMELIQNPKISFLTSTEIDKSKKYDIVVEVTGRKESISIALSHLGVRGELVLKSTVTEPDTIDLNKIVVDEITIIGSRCGPFEHALTLIED